MKKKTFLVLFVFGLALRLFLSLTTYHQDLGAITLSSKYILSGQVLSFYEQSGKDISQTIFNYQPLAYLIPSFFYLPFSDYLTKVGESYLNSDWQKSYHLFFNFDLLLFKYPHLLADLLIFLLLGVIFATNKNKQLLQLLWWLNPITIFVSSLIGQVDIFIALFLLLSYYFYQQKKFLISILFISLSALIKPVGLVLLPFIIWPTAKTSVQKIGSSLFSTAIGLAIYLFGISPYLSSVAYRHYALFADQINKTTYGGIAISPGTVIPLFFVGLFFVYFHLLNNKLSLARAFSLVLMSSLVFTNFHPQWFVWVVPFLIISQNPSLTPTVVSFSWLLVLFSFDKTLHLSSFINLKITFFDSILTNNFFQTLTLMARGALVAIYLMLFKDDEVK